MWIEWDAEAARHIGTRAGRYGDDARNFLPEWANEAVSDVEATTLPISDDHPYQRVTTGYSSGYGGLITVVYLVIGEENIGVTAYPARGKL